MASDYGVAPLPELDEDQEALRDTLVETLHSNELQHLRDILQGETDDLGRYYGDGSSSGTSEDALATRLVSNYENEVEQFLYRADHHFTYSKIRRNDLVDILAEEGIPRAFIEDHDPKYNQFLLLVYHALDGPKNPSFEDKYELLAAKTRLFKERSDRTYTYEDTEIVFDKLDTLVKNHVRRKNGPNKRPFTIRHYKSESEGMVVFDFYKETARTARNVFKRRAEDTSSVDFSNPTVTHEPAFPVRTLHIRLEELDDGRVKAMFSESPKNSGWKEDVEEFFDRVIGISDPLNEANLQRDAGAGEVLDVAVDVASQEDSSDEDIAESIEDKVSELAEPAVEDTDSDEIEDSEEELREKYESIKLVGFIVDGDDDTLTDEYSVTSQTGLVDLTADNAGPKESMKYYFSEADRENIGLRFRGQLRGEDEFDEFVLWDGRWEPDSRVPDEAIRKINHLFQDDDAN